MDGTDGPVEVDNRMDNADTKLQNLREWMQKKAENDICIAFSGGVDSSLLLKIAAEETEKKGTKVYGVTFVSRLSPKADLDIARKVAEECGAEFEVLYIDESENEELLKNTRQRCYLCKKHLFSELIRWAHERGVYTVLEGTNADDLNVYRPGLKAVRELEAESPLALLEISKEEVRSFASQCGLSVASRPSAPCMATRIPYDTPLDFEVLAKLEQGELKLKEMGFELVRLRLHGDIVRIEVPREQLGQLTDHSDTAVKILKEIGFKYITLDLEGFRSGSMDEV